MIADNKEKPDPAPEKQEDGILSTIIGIAVAVGIIALIGIGFWKYGGKVASWVVGILLSPMTFVGRQISITTMQAVLLYLAIIVFVIVQDWIYNKRPRTGMIFGGAYILYMVLGFFAFIEWLFY